MYCNEHKIYVKRRLNHITHRIQNCIYYRSDYIDFKRKKQYSVYKITNLINDMIYVGMTGDSVFKRLQTHIKFASKNTNCKLALAIQKFGKENFKIEILETFDTALFCKASEIYWIEKLKSFYWDNSTIGYNMTKGGDGTFGLRLTQQQIANKIKIHPNKRKVCKYDKNHTLIQTYASIIEAAKDVSISSANIVNCCKGIRKTVGGYYWRYPNQDFDYELKIGRKRKVNQYDLQGNYIKTFSSLTEAAKELCISHTKISECCTKKRKSTGNFCWKYHDN